MPPRVQNSSSTRTGTPPVQRDHVIGIPEKCDQVQSLLDPLCLLHAATLHAIVTSQAEGGYFAARLYQPISWLSSEEHNWLPASFPGHHLPASYPGHLPASFPDHLPTSYPGHLPTSFPASYPGHGIMLVLCK